MNLDWKRCDIFPFITLFIFFTHFFRVVMSSIACFSSYSVSCYFSTMESIDIQRAVIGPKFLIKFHMETFYALYILSRKIFSMQDFASDPIRVESFRVRCRERRSRLHHLPKCFRTAALAHEAHCELQPFVRLFNTNRSRNECWVTLKIAH